MAKVNVVCKNKKNYKEMKELLDDRGYSFKKDKENLTLTVKKTSKSEIKDLVEMCDIDAKVKKVKVEKEKEEEAPEIPVLDNAQDVENEREEDVEEGEEEYEDDEEEMEEEEEIECE